jgi:hypothetical protein
VLNSTDGIAYVDGTLYYTGHNSLFSISGQNVVSNGDGYYLNPSVKTNTGIQFLNLPNVNATSFPHGAYQISPYFDQGLFISTSSSNSNSNNAEFCSNNGQIDINMCNDIPNTPNFASATPLN